MSAWGKTLSGLAIAACLHSAAAAEVVVDVRDANGNPVHDAVLFAEPAAGAASAPKANATAMIDQVNKEFVPRVSIVQAGTSVNFPNSDNIRHSIYSFSPAKTFQTKLYAGRGAPPVTFDKAGIVVLGCNIHDQMVAWVVIVDTPWFGKSGLDGVATLHDVPNGDYQLTAAAPSLSLPPSTTSLRIEGAALRRTIRLAAGG
jgi:plastocyanin